MFKKKYLVSFFFSRGGNNGWGNQTIKAKKIRDTDLETITGELIEHGEYDEVVISNIIKLDN